MFNVGTLRSEELIRTSCIQVLTTITEVFSNVYHESIGSTLNLYKLLLFVSLPCFHALALTATSHLTVASLNYIALGIGFTGMSQISARMLDPVYRKLSKQNGGVGKPEFRMALLLPGPSHLSLSAASDCIAEGCVSFDLKEVFFCPSD
jgi:hypothetical protein